LSSELSVGCSWSGLAPGRVDGGCGSGGTGSGAAEGNAPAAPVEVAREVGRNGHAGTLGPAEPPRSAREEGVDTDVVAAGAAGFLFIESEVEGTAADESLDWSERFLGSGSPSGEMGSASGLERTKFIVGALFGAAPPWLPWLAVRLRAFGFALKTASKDADDVGDRAWVSVERSMGIGGGGLSMTGIFPLDDLVLELISLPRPPLNRPNRPLTLLNGADDFTLPAPPPFFCFPDVDVDLDGPSNALWLEPVLFSRPLCCELAFPDVTLPDSGPCPR